MRGLGRLFSHSRVRVMFLQSLVAGILSYELLVSNETIYGQNVSRMVALGLMLISMGIILLPKAALESTWFPGALISINTLLVTGTIYLSGNASSELYLTYFLLLLIASSAPSLKQLLGLSVIICAGYGILVYEHAMQSGTLAVGHLLGIPVLLIMSVFYGLTLETVAVERRRNRLLREDVQGLKQSEQVLEERRTQLETRVQGLKQGLSRANQEIRQGMVERTGLERQLREAQKFEAMGRLASRLAHEFNQVLAVIGAQTGAIVSKLKPDDPCMGRWKTSSGAESVRQPSPRNCSHWACTKRAFATPCRSARRLCRCARRSRHCFPGGLMCGYLTSPSRCWWKLVMTGWSACCCTWWRMREMPCRAAGGWIFRWKWSPESCYRQSNSKNPRKRMARIAVSDSGGGMNLDVQAQMFEPFFSTKETHAGLGLTLVYGIVRQCGGTVEVQSQPGQGTTVRVYLPLVERNAVLRDSRVLPEALSKGAETVLLVEEDEIARKLALSTLHGHRYHVLEAGSAVEALLVAQQYQGPIHLTVSHLSMPEISGRELAKRLVLQHPKMKALFVSGFSDETIASHRVNRKYFLQQPYRQHDLAGKVRELLDV